MILASGLAAGAGVALGLTLVASVRRRRRDLALLKTLGFTRNQLAETVAWQASVAAVIGVVIGVPVGIALGRWLWDLFARAIFAVPAPTVPVATGRARRGWGCGARQHRGRRPRPHGRPHPDSPVTANRISTRPVAVGRVPRSVDCCRISAWVNYLGGAEPSRRATSPDVHALAPRNEGPHRGTRRYAEKRRSRRESPALASGTTSSARGSRVTRAASSVLVLQVTVPARAK